MTKRCRRALALAAPLLALLPPTAAAGDAFLSTQVGGFIPWQGDAGVSTTLQLLGSNAAGTSRWGGEFEFRAFDSKIQGVRNVDVESYLIRGMWQYHFRPDARLTPYVGVGFGVTINVVDDEKVDAAHGRDVRGSTGAGLDGLFLIGLSGNVAEYVSLFAEGRVGMAFDVSGRNDRDALAAETVGGATLAAGVRFRF